jgi:carboxymethylenebutenolidase
MTSLPVISPAMIALYDRFTHGNGEASRRELVAGIAKLAGGVAAATAVLPLIEARADAAALTAETDARLIAERVVYAGAGNRRMVGYLARPVRGAARLPKVLVIHENRGLTAHIRDITRRLALAGHVALAPDFLTAVGETPRSGDGRASADDIARQLIGNLDRGTTIADGVASLEWLEGHQDGKGVPGAIGFCWGGGMVNSLAIAAGNKLRAGVAYYGPAPADTSAVDRIKARLLLHYAGLDDRVNAGADAWQAALTGAGVRFEAHIYPGVNHAFNNDTSAARFDKTAAALAWDRSLAWLKL